MTSAIGMAKGMNHMSNAHPDEAMETLDAAMEKVHQLQQQLAAAREDSARLDWLLWKLPGDAIRHCVGEISDTSDGSEFRAAIDAAMARK